MYQATINIGVEINVEKLLYSRALIQASSGGGKSHLVRKIAECIGNGYQQIIIDPEGEFVTLREKFDFALVSKDGDIPLNIRYAELIAHTLLETNVSAIVDLYELKPYERVSFVKEFIGAIMNAPKELWHPCFIYLDEAHIFCPEGSKSESASAVIDLCSRGRKRGYCAILSTQRIGKLNKDASAELINKIIGLTNQDIDKKRTAFELGFTDKKDIAGLGRLATGVFYGSGPAISNDVVQFKCLPVVTTHLTPGKKLPKTIPTPKAIQSILSKLQSIPEEAEKELITKQQLQSEVKRLNHENKLLQQKTKLPAAVSVPVDTKLVDNLKAQLQQKETNQAIITAFANECHTKLISTVNVLKTIQDKAGIEIIIPDKPKFTPGIPKKLSQVSQPETFKKIVRPKPTIQNNFSGILPVGEKKLLIACGQYEKGLNRNQITAITAYKRSSRDAYIQRLMSKDFLTKNGDRIMITQAGIDALGNDYEQLPTGVELQEYWLGVLPAGEGKILRLVLDAYPNDISREEITEKTNYLRSSRDAYIQRLASKEIIQTTGPGYIKACEILFN